MINGFVKGTHTRFTQRELAEVQRSFAAAYNHEFATTHRLAQGLFRNWVMGYDTADFVAAPDRSFAVTLPEVNAAAAACAQHAVVSLLGDMRVMRRLPSVGASGR